MTELVERFGTSPERAQILRGLKAYRDALRNIGITTGFQWVDGSFVEACESVKGRPPADVDVLSIIMRPQAQKADNVWQAFIQANMNLFDPTQCKAAYSCDGYFIDLGTPADLVARSTAYWFGLFSHQRDTFRWKGLVEISLQSDDDAAMLRLDQIEASW